MLIRRALVVLSAMLSALCIGAAGVKAHGPAGATTSTLVNSAVKLAVGGSHACAIVEGHVYCWGDNASGQLGNLDSDKSATNVPIEVPGISTAIAITAGYAHTCAVLSDGTVWCWGSNESKQIGRPSGVSGLPAAMAGLSDVKSISSWNATTCAVVGAAGGVKCWGANGGATGAWLGRTTPNGSADADPVPGFVTGLASGVARVSVGQSSACALMVNKTLKCWGNNYEGRLGDGTTTSTTDTSGPVDVVGLADVAAVSVGSAHTCAVLSTGKVYCWGQWESGQLGIDLGINDIAVITARGGGLTPLETLDARGSSTQLSNAQSISAGQSFSCATRITGGVSCWGLNSAGELGTGGKSQYVLAPVTIANFSNVATVAAGSGFACAITTDSIVKCWGGGGFATNAGQIGNGSNAESLTPATVKGAAPQTITFAALSDKAMGDAAFSVSATSSSGGEVSFSSTTSTVCTVSGSMVTLVAPGTCTISASRGEYGLYKAATTVSQSFRVGGLKPTAKTGTASPQSTKATLRGTVNPGGADTTITFVYGTDPKLSTGTTTVKTSNKSTTADEEILATISDLTESTTYYYRIDATNSVGSASGAIVPFKTHAPEGVSINDGDEFTNTTTVTVSVVGPANSSKVLVSNDGGFKTATSFNLVDSAADIPWTLQASRDGTFSKTVYVRFLSRFDAKVTDDKTDDIILDTSKPVLNTVQATAASGGGEVTVAAARAKSTGVVKISVQATDTISGAVAVEIRSASSKPATTVKLGKAPSKVKTLGQPRKTVASVSVKTTSKKLQVRAIDGAGNTSGWKVVTVK